MRAKPILVGMGAPWHAGAMRRLTLLGCFAVLLTPAVAHANGRIPASVNTRYQPGNDTRILLPATFGLLISEDDGASFRWICEDTIGYGGTYDPDYAINEAGHIFATTFGGLRVSKDDGCTFEDTQFYDDPTGGSSPVLLEDIWVGEVEIASDGKIWAATSTGTGKNNIFVSTDGTTFNGSNLFDEVAWWKSLRVAPSNPNVLYVSGFLVATVDPNTGDVITPAEALLYYSNDGGASWVERATDDFTFGTQPNLLIVGVSPTDPATVFARAIGVAEPTGDALYRSTDSGANWEKVLDLPDTMTAFTIRADGSVIAATSTPCDGEPLDMPKGCVHISPSGAAGTFTHPSSEPRMACVGERSADGALFACGSNWDPDNFALGRSSDNGQTWSKVVRFSEIAGPLECPSGTAQFECQTLTWPSLCQQLGICAPADGGPGADGSVVNVGDAGTGGGGGGLCGCQTSSRAGSALLWMALVALGLARRRRR